MICDREFLLLLVITLVFLQVNAVKTGKPVRNSGSNDAWVFSGNNSGITKRSRHHVPIGGRSLSLGRIHRKIDRKFKNPVEISKRSLEPNLPNSDRDARSSPIVANSIDFDCISEGFREFLPKSVARQATNSNFNSDDYKNFLVASSQGKLKRIERMVRRGIDVDYEDDVGRTAIFHATIEKRFDTVEFLLPFVSSLNKPDVHGMTVLHYAAKLGHNRIAELLIKSNRLQINQCDSLKNWTALHFATANEYRFIVAYLIEAGANLNVMGKEGETPLHLASGIKEDCDGIVKMLFRKGANMIVQDDFGRTPLHVAALSNNVEIMAYLILNNSNLDHQDKKGSTPLHLACEKGHLEAVKLLLAMSADPNLVDSQGMNCLHLACSANKFPVAERLLRYITNIDSKNEEGKTALYMATSLGYLRIIRLLVKNNASVFTGSRDGKVKTVVHAALAGGSDLVSDYLYNSLRSKDSSIVAPQISSYELLSDIDG